MLLNSDKVLPVSFLPVSFLPVSLRSLAMRRMNSLLGAAFHGWAALGGFTKITLCLLAVIVGAAISSEVFSQSPSLDIFRREKDKKAPVDYGFGPGAGIGPARIGPHISIASCGRTSPCGEY
jgi:hypothetical protein